MELGSVEPLEAAGSFDSAGEPSFQVQAGLRVDVAASGQTAFDRVEASFAFVVELVNREASSVDFEVPYYQAVVDSFLVVRSLRRQRQRTDKKLIQASIAMNLRIPL